MYARGTNLQRVNSVTIINSYYLRASPFSVSWILFTTNIKSLRNLSQCLKWFSLELAAEAYTNQMQCNMDTKKGVGWGESEEKVEHTVVSNVPLLNASSQ
jgi:hypothetical protein